MFCLLGSRTAGICGRPPLEDKVRLCSLGGSAIEFSLNLDGIAGVCGVCGEIGFPGEDDAETDAAATMPGTLVNCRLDELEERFICTDDVMDSVKALFDSFIM